MGASAARDADARLSLAVPVHTTVGSRRILDPKASQCAVCRARFVPLLRGKHYCRRCGAIVCEACTSLRLYGDRVQQEHQRGGTPPPVSPTGTARSSDSMPASPTTTSKPMPTKFRVCTPCNLRRSAVHVLPHAVWERILTFAGDVAHHHVLQTCRKLQQVANLPYPTGSGWDAFFGESTFLAKGANGAVYRAALHGHIAQRLGLRGAPTVAVKVVNKSTVLSLRKWRHVMREVDAMRACRHPNVLRLIGVFQSPEAVFIVLEYAPGGDVFDWLVARRGCTEPEARGVMKQLLVALQHMHDNVGAVHRDVKPENLLLLERSQAPQHHHGHRSMVGGGVGGSAMRGAVPPIVLGDFGYARVFPESVNPRRPPTAAAPVLPVASAQAARLEAANREVTAKATPCGTLGFAPPEVLQAYADRKAQPQSCPAAPITPVDVMKKTDVFAAGVTMCLLLTATEPFPCHSSAANVAAVQRGIDFSQRHWAHVSGSARALIRAMLAPRAEDRPSAYDCLASDWFAAAAPTPDPMARAGRQNTAAAPPAEQQLPRPNAEELASSARSLRKNAGVYAPVGTLLSTTATTTTTTLGSSSHGTKSLSPSTCVGDTARRESATSLSPGAGSLAPPKKPNDTGSADEGVLLLSRQELDRQDRVLDRLQLQQQHLQQQRAQSARSVDSSPSAGQPSPGVHNNHSFGSSSHGGRGGTELDGFE
uniref:Protein kinase n=1 Tax=Neobodo designis TaxID=312471 RepID=A0A7S1PKP2_NEODS|mmetsp:Transcript_10241/g.31629  ORF Transcript_10241/g.31629 Transcript_10241/m.31629 type:complete len:707 (+) Transcript_10241:80-2200(+)|eukprot:CAMPEP_0174861996 /NCGR_PEP_ID=MMETSP1114-20130205/52990_1 /TAXON_ID=312471 /ORGANISM="Neobodo designis, Strain CCAP 1951/1" /LENGTH=706 /DNA_ID=CAMNT_0016097027 /DNA_START=79 /DNA_END=2199 /DNA_ORIENTATION=-